MPELKNQLARASSPYLLQHKDNPVHWREWGHEALAEAQRLGKPILLSVGYAACHWCHVMAHESFEDESTAALMNALFVNIKVDREERPDIDHIYMTALHAMGERGGWPLTMFLDPQGRPFWGGTYFPRDRSYERPSFKDVLAHIDRVYREKPDDIARSREALGRALTPNNSVSTDRPPPLTLADIDGFARTLFSHMDAANGGLQGAPKFPNVPILELFWRAAERTGDDRLMQPFTTALDAICSGGIRDHIGGGFARYAVDEEWRVPHFEKMLYDNAQLLDALALAFATTNETKYRAAATELVQWLVADMQTVDDTFAASLDADSEGVEGKYYGWTRAELAATLAPDDAALAALAWDVRDPPNWREAHTGMQTNILNTLHRPTLSDSDRSRLEVLRTALREARANRVPPGRDDKALADWNGMMIAALVHAGLAFDEPGWIDHAARAFDAILSTMTRTEGDALRIAHSWRDGRAIWPGMASDYAFMITAALALAEAGARTRHDALGSAIALARALIRWHQEDQTGLLTMSARDADDVIVHVAPTNDDAIPNANAIFVAALYKLAALSGDDDWRRMADESLAAQTPAARQNPFGHAALLNAIDTRARAADVIVTGSNRTTLIEAARRAIYVTRHCIQRPDDGPAQATVCVDSVCSLPVRSPEDLRATMRAMRREPPS